MSALLKLLKDLKFQMPNWLTVALGLIGGVLVYLNQQKTFQLSPEWSQLVKYGIIIIGTFVGPLVGSAFKNALPLSHKVITALSAVAGVLAAVVSTVDVSSPLKGVLLGVLAFLAWAGIGPAASAVAAAVWTQVTTSSGGTTGVAVTSPPPPTVAPIPQRNAPLAKSPATEEAKRVLVQKPPTPAAKPRAPRKK